MTKEEAIKELKTFQGYYDVEPAHSEADDVLCGLLISLGYDDVVEEYNKVSKRYG